VDQAVIAGVFAAFSTFTKTTYIAYAVALLPFFVFDYWFYVVDPLLTSVGVLDGLGNIVILVLCYLGWRAVGVETNVEASGRVTVSSGLSTGQPSPFQSWFR
jgi:hypothetical protein